MAVLYFDDFSEIWKDFEKHVGDSDAIAETMLLYGAKEVIDNWEKVIQKEELIDSHSLIDSIAMIGNPQKVAGVWQVDVGPTGKDEKGVRNAEKAFHLNYGTSDIDARHFMDDILLESELSLERVCKDVIDSYEATGLLPIIDKSLLKAKKQSRKKG